jgi:micrococcal nuclease
MSRTEILRKIPRYLLVTLIVASIGSALPPLNLLKDVAVRSISSGGGVGLVEFLPIIFPFSGIGIARAEKPKSVEPSVFTKNEYTAEVINIVDGDTIDVLIPELGKDFKVRVRYIGVDTPELHHPKKPVQPYAKEAMEKNTKLVMNKKVTLELDVQKADRYGRLLAYVFVGEGKKKIFVNEYLVKNGYAVVATFPPNVKYVDLFVKAQQYAKEHKLGLWSGK